MQLPDKNTFVEILKTTRKYLSVGFEMEMRLSEWLNLEDVDHPLVTYCFFITDMLEKLFDDRIISDWIYEDIRLDEKGGFETHATANCGK